MGGKRAEIFPAKAVIRPVVQRLPCLVCACAEAGKPVRGDFPCVRRRSVPGEHFNWIILRLHPPRVNHCVLWAVPAGLSCPGTTCRIGNPNTCSVSKN